MLEWSLDKENKLLFLDRKINLQNDSATYKTNVISRFAVELVWENTFSLKIVRKKIGNIIVSESELLKNHIIPKKKEKKYCKWKDFPIWWARRVHFSLLFQFNTKNISWNTCLEVSFMTFQLRWVTYSAKAAVIHFILLVSNIKSNTWLVYHVDPYFNYFNLFLK